MSTDFGECAYCGSVLPDEEWCPVVTSEEDGAVVVHSFCDDDCKAAWLDAAETEA